MGFKAVIFELFTTLITEEPARMGAVPAKRFTNLHPCKYDNVEGVSVAEEPLELLEKLHNRIKKSSSGTDVGE